MCVLCYLCFVHFVCVCVFCVYVCVCVCVCVCIYVFFCVHGKESACQCKSHRRRGFDPWVGKIPWRMEWQPSPLFLPGKSHRQRSFGGLRSIWSRESDMMEQRSMCLCICLHVCLFVLYASGCACVCARMCVCPLGDHQNQGWWSNVVTPQCAHSLRWGGGGG